MSECKTPGICTCLGMKRCPSCGYTKHDKEYWMDHYLCDLHRKRKAEKPRKENKDMVTRFMVLFILLCGLSRSPAQADDTAGAQVSGTTDISTRCDDIETAIDYVNKTDDRQNAKIEELQRRVERLQEEVAGLKAQTERLGQQLLQIQRRR